MQFLVNVRDDKLGKPVIQGTKTDEDGVEAIFQNFTHSSTTRRQEFMRKLKEEGASSYQTLGDQYSITAMKVGS